jgi:AraC-like DNA-binding protein
MRMEQPALTVSQIASGSGWSLDTVVCRQPASFGTVDERHSQHVMAIVQRGTFTYHGRTGREILHGGAMLLGNSGTCYSCGHSHDNGDICHSLRLAEETYDELAFAVTGRANFHFPTACLPIGPRLLRACTLLFGRADDGMAREEKVLAFSACVLSVCSGKHGRTQLHSADERRIELALHVIDTSFTDKLTLHGLSATVGMTKFHFLRQFTRMTGATPYKHILRRRLAEAARRLAVESGSVSNIAFDCGFGDLSTFNRSFKLCFGATPTAFRNAA